MRQKGTSERLKSEWETGIEWLEAGGKVTGAVITGRFGVKFFAGAGNCGCGNLLISVRMRAPLPHI